MRNEFATQIICHYAFVKMFPFYYMSPQFIYSSCLFLFTCENLLGLVRPLIYELSKRSTNIICHSANRINIEN